MQNRNTIQHILDLQSISLDLNDKDSVAMLDENKHQTQ